MYRGAYHLKAMQTSLSVERTAIPLCICRPDVGGHHVSSAASTRRFRIRRDRGHSPRRPRFRHRHHGHKFRSCFRLQHSVECFLLNTKERGKEKEGRCSFILANSLLYHFIPFKSLYSSNSCFKSLFAFILVPRVTKNEPLCMYV